MELYTLFLFASLFSFQVVRGEDAIPANQSPITYVYPMLDDPAFMKTLRTEDYNVCVKTPLLDANGTIVTDENGNTQYALGQPAKDRRIRVYTEQECVNSFNATYYPSDGECISRSGNSYSFQCRWMNSYIRLPPRGPPPYFGFGEIGDDYYNPGGDEVVRFTNDECRTIGGWFDDPVSGYCAPTPSSWEDAYSRNQTYLYQLSQARQEVNQTVTNG